MLRLRATTLPVSPCTVVVIGEAPGALGGRYFDHPAGPCVGARGNSNCFLSDAVSYYYPLVGVGVTYLYLPPDPTLETPTSARAPRAARRPPQSRIPHGVETSNSAKPPCLLLPFQSTPTERPLLGWGLGDTARTRGLYMLEFGRAHRAQSC